MTSQFTDNSTVCSTARVSDLQNCKHHGPHCRSFVSVWGASTGDRCFFPLTHRGRVTHICVSDLTSIGSDNGLSPGRRQAIIKTNAGILLIRPLGVNFSEFLVEILIFSFKKMRLKVSSAKRRPFCLGLNELNTKGQQCSKRFNVMTSPATELCHTELDRVDGMKQSTRARPRWQYYNSVNCTNRSNNKMNPGYFSLANMVANSGTAD